MSADWDGAGCPPEELHRRDLEGELAGILRARLAAHLESCPSCRSWREEARKDDELAVELRQLYAERARIEAPWGPGAHIGEFELLRRLGDGGMGVVYEALQNDPRRRVAVKLLRAGLHGPEALWRFRHEAQVLGRLQHPGIAQVYRAGTVEVDGRQQPFLAMELVEGQRLDEHAIVRGDDVAAKLALFRALCDAVHHAHLRGVVHRDLKPGNVLVDAAGHPKVLDFGIAQWSAEDGGDRARLTRAGQILGTLPYMSPEQVQGNPDAIDVRSDVYALGVILFEILTGQLPHALDGRSTTEAIRRIVDEEAPRLGQVRRELRGELDWIAAKALAKDPARRYPSAAALGEDLRRFAAHEPIAARPPSAAYLAAKLLRRHRAPVIGAALVFVALAIGLSTTYLQAERARGAERESSARRLDAEREAALAKAVSSYLERFLGAVDVQRGGKRRATRWPRPCPRPRPRSTPNSAAARWSARTCA